MLCLMRDVCSLIWLALVGLFQSRVSLEAEILALRHQLNVLWRKSPKKLSFTSMDLYLQDCIGWRLACRTLSRSSSRRR